MSDQNKLILSGVATVGVAKFLLHKDWKMAGLYGLAVIAAIAIVKAHNT